MGVKPESHPLLRLITPILHGAIIMNHTAHGRAGISRSSEISSSNEVLRAVRKSVFLYRPLRQSTLQLLRA